MYACKYEYYEKYMVRKYGAHGTSHKYLAQEAKKYTNGNKVITCHIGSGASLCASKDCKCVSTSMGLTPLAGIMMATRTGDIDASVMNYLVTNTGKSCEEIAYATERDNFMSASQALSFGLIDKIVDKI